MGSCPSRLHIDRPLLVAFDNVAPAFLLAFHGWLRGSVVERRSSAGVLSLSCARPVADGCPLMWVNRPLWVNQPGQLSLSSLRGR